MDAITRKLVDFLRKEDGPTAVEYAVMLALIIVVRRHHHSGLEHE